ncbi:MAG: haloacid dehalogenase [Nitrospira sp.]|nr:haloacid dehalogenase [Nitrospira sp.]MCP9463372.1 haloacid dehalogenase [Nitrospira sp.]
MKTNIPWPQLEAIHTIAFDFDGVFTDNKVYVSETGMEHVRCDRADGLAIDLLRSYKRVRALDFQMIILSKEKNPVVAARARKLGIRCVSGKDHKLNWLKTFFESTRPHDIAPFTGLIYLGNDLNDLPAIECAGFSVVPADAHPLLRSAASVVLNTLGGCGFVREFVERLLRLGQMNREELYELIHNSGDRHQS